MRLFSRAMVHFTLCLSIALNVGIAIYYRITDYSPGAIGFTVMALLALFSYFGFKDHMKFSTVLLQAVIDMPKHNTSVLVVVLVALVVQVGLSVWYAFTIIATYAKYAVGSPACPNGAACSTSRLAGFLVYDTFSYLWASQVVGNVVIATLAGGPYGVWYHYGVDGEGKPNRPTVASFCRASIFSLGSIAFGSLFVAIIELLRLLCQLV